MEILKTESFTWALKRKDYFKVNYDDNGHDTDMKLSVKKFY